jgi:hypothetical protein
MMDRLRSDPGQPFGTSLYVAVPDRSLLDILPGGAAYESALVEFRRNLANLRGGRDTDPRPRIERAGGFPTESEITELSEALTTIELLEGGSRYVAALDEFRTQLHILARGARLEP